MCIMKCRDLPGKLRINSAYKFRLSFPWSTVHRRTYPVDMRNCGMLIAICQNLELSFISWSDLIVECMVVAVVLSSYLGSVLLGQIVIMAVILLSAHGLSSLCPVEHKAPFGYSGRVALNMRSC